MAARRILVVHYSRTGRTRQVARELETVLGADREEIGDPADRTGTIGYLRCALEALLGASAEIEPPKRDPSRYDVVVVGTPVWYASVSSPVRTYLWLERGRLPKVAFLLTHGGMGADRVFGQMSALAGKLPVARLVVREREIESGSHAEKVASFARSLLASARRARPGRARRSGK
jgi:flavodoxin